MSESMVRYKVYGDSKMYYGAIREQPTYTYIGDVRLIRGAETGTVLCAPFSYQYMSDCLDNGKMLTLFDTGKDGVHLPLCGDRVIAAESTEHYIMGSRFTINSELYVFDRERLVLDEFCEGKTLLQGILNNTVSNTYFVLAEANELVLLPSNTSVYFSGAGFQKTVEFLASFISPYDYLMKLDNYSMARFSLTTASRNPASALIIAAHLIRDAGAKFTAASLLGAWIAAAGYNDLPSPYDVEDLRYRYSAISSTTDVIAEYQKYKSLFDSSEWGRR